MTGWEDYMSNNFEIQVFENVDFGEMRSCIENDGTILFCASDVAKALGYSRPNDAVNAHCRATVKRRTPISGKTQEINFIPEGDVYRLIVKSKLPSAVKFEHWVFDEVLPSIRKTGGYKLPQTFSEALRALADAEEEKERLAAKIETDKPKVMFAEAVDCSPTAIKIGDLAKILKQNGIDIGRNRLFIWLRENGYIMKNTVNGFSNMPTQMAMELGLFEVKEHHYDRGENTILGSTTLVTVKGQKYFINLFLKQAA
jgi:anti-repressor protein